MAVKKIKINPYKRRSSKGKLVSVKGFSRKKRTRGKKVKFIPVGEFQVAQDENGNLRGSRVVRKAPRLGTPKRTRKSSRLDKLYENKKITLKQYLKRRSEALRG